MIQTYNLKGMTCGGCKASVEKYLDQVDNIINVEANVQTAEVEVTMISHIDTEILKRALPDKFTLSEKVL
ncbi:heavy-metal-associated domain-containing protein [Nonlabens antarcticus]|uniref:heavy-metal-associated domain-containing protein n=1 Tax=Nonlabens antarcticus TaxID=392714 RepID=UPI0018917EC8|nr:heavy metal-associated domain-containing protein [Nonlabens antarcticus]